MNRTMLSGLRWLLLLPSGIIAVLVVSYLLRLLFQHLFFHLSLAIETNMVTVINAAVFVLVCSYIAPGDKEKRMNVVLILFTIIIAIFIILNLSGKSIFGFGIRFDNGWLSLTLAIIGALIGFALVPKDRGTIPHTPTSAIQH